MLIVAIAVVVIGFARRPLLDGDNEASGYSPPLTLWVTGAEADGKASAVAAQAASCWSLHGTSATVGVLPGDSSNSIVDFLQQSRAKSGDLLVLTSSTIAGIVHERDDRELPEEARERASQALSLLARATPISMLASDPLMLAARPGSPLRSGAQVLALMRQAPARPLFDVGDDAWLQGNLAALVQDGGLHGDVPYAVFDSSREALASLDDKEDDVVVAPRSAIERELRRNQLRDLGWPASSGATPRAWLAVVGSSHLPPAAARALRTDAETLCPSALWARLLRREGLSPPTFAQRQVREFVEQSIDEAARDQALAMRIMRDYH